MIGFILAAGFGTRLRPITNHMPKALVPVGGVPMLKRMLDDFATAGFSTLGANIHYRPEDIAAYCSTYEHPVTLFHEKGKIRGTGGALYFAREFLAAQDSFCIRNVDILSGIDLRALKSLFESSNADCMLVAAGTSGPGTICMENGKTGKYRGLPGDISDTSACKGVDYIGLSFYRKRFLSLVNENDFSLVPVWKRAVDNGQTVLVHEIENLYWRDIGTPHSLAHIHFDILDEKIPLTLPDDYVCDYRRKYACRKTAEPRKDALGPYSWCDTAALSGEHSYERSLIWAESTQPQRKHAGIIATPWGDMHFE